MTKEIMTIHKALADLKTLDKRIEDTIKRSVFCVANKHSNDKINGVPLKEYENQMRGSFDKLTDLISRRNALKNAVSLSNAVTKVKIGNKEYTIAEAINMKNHGIELQVKALKAMEKDFDKANAEIFRNNGKDLEERADQYVTSIYGSKEGKVNTDDYVKVRKDFIDAQSYELIDPLNVHEKIEIMRNYIDSFTSEVDAAISVSNALTQIEIEY